MSFNNQEADRIYLKTHNGDPAVYIFSIESSGQYKNSELFKLALDELLQLLNTCEHSLKYDSTSNITISKADCKMDAFDFVFLNENNTLGNLLTQYLNYDKDVEFCGYKVPHPLETKIVLRLSTKIHTKLEAVNKILEILTNLQNKCKILRKEWDQVLISSKLEDH